MIDEIDHAADRNALFVEMGRMSRGAQRGLWTLLDERNHFEIVATRQRIELVLLRTIAILTSLSVIAIILWVRR
jgi:hypothetical protein